eukprot:1137360-Pelagomonas_calceolata.AAC.4
MGRTVPLPLMSSLPELMWAVAALPSEFTRFTLHYRNQPSSLLHTALERKQSALLHVSVQHLADPNCDMCRIAAQVHEGC